MKVAKIVLAMVAGEVLSPRKLFNPFITVDHEIGWNALEDLIRVDDKHDGNGGPVKEKGTDYSQWIHDQLGDDVQVHDEPGITAAADDSGVDRHLIGHGEDDKRLNVHENIGHLPGLRGNLVEGQERETNKGIEESEYRSDQDKQNLQGAGVFSQLVHLTGADGSADNDACSGGGTYRGDLEQ